MTTTASLSSLSGSWRFADAAAAERRYVGQAKAVALNCVDWLRSMGRAVRRDPKAYHLSTASMMEPQSVTFNLELRDYEAMAAFVCAPASTQSKWLRWVITPLSIFLTIGIASPFVESILSFLLGMLALLFWLWVAIKFLVPRAQRRLEPVPGGTILCEYHVTLSDSGVDIRTPEWDALTRWSGIVSVDEASEHVFLRIDTSAAYTVPKRAFVDDDARRRFVSGARAQLEPRVCER